MISPLSIELALAMVANGADGATKKELEKLKFSNQYRTIPNVESKTDGKICIDGVEYFNLASNDYLGISTKNDLRKEFLKTNDSYVSRPSSPNIGYSIFPSSYFFLIIILSDFKSE